MKKSILSILITLFSGSIIVAQSVQIPNSSFEKWEKGDTIVTGWFSTNDIAVSKGFPVKNVSKNSTVKSAGNYSLQLKTYNFSGAKIPAAITNGKLPDIDFSDPKVTVNSIIPASWDYGENPQNFSVDLNYTRGGSDTGIFLVRFFKNHNKIGEGLKELTASSSGSTLTTESVTINYSNSAVADSFFIYFSSSYSRNNKSTNFDASSTLIVDKLAFTGLSGVQKNLSFDHFELSPNPTKNNITLNAAGLKQAESKISIYNSLGSLVAKEELKSAGSISHTIPMTSLPSGIYFIQVQNGDLITTKRVIKE
jgi:hypothetical protein